MFNASRKRSGGPGPFHGPVQQHVAGPVPGCGRRPPVALFWSAGPCPEEADAAQRRLRHGLWQMWLTPPHVDPGPDAPQVPLGKSHHLKGNQPAALRPADAPRPRPPRIGTAKPPPASGDGRGLRWCGTSWGRRPTPLCGCRHRQGKRCGTTLILPQPRAPAQVDDPAEVSAFPRQIPEAGPACRPRPGRAAVGDGGPGRRYSPRAADDSRRRCPSPCPVMATPIVAAGLQRSLRPWPESRGQLPRRRRPRHGSSAAARTIGNLMSPPLYLHMLMNWPHQ